MMLCSENYLGQNCLIYHTNHRNLFYVPLNNKEIEQTTTAVWLIKLIDQSLLFFPNGLTPKKFDFFFIKEKINLGEHQQQHFLACCFQLTKNNRQQNRCWCNLIYFGYFEIFRVKMLDLYMSDVLFRWFNDSKAIRNFAFLGKKWKLRAKQVFMRNLFC